MKVLFVASVKEHINSFHLPYLKYFNEQGFEVHVAISGDAEFENCHRQINVPFARNPFKLTNLKAFVKLKKLIETEKYEIIHCHTPVAAFLTRLSAIKARKKFGTKVIYTAHGFHFFKGAPILNWLIYYPIERLTAHFTDVLITINKEDYERAKKFAAKKVCYVPGVGINTERFAECKKTKHEMRKELGISEDAIMLVSVGELNKNKNHRLIINALAELSYSNIHYCIAGVGNAREELIKLTAEKGMEEKVHLLGRREDICELYNSADIFCFPSHREGLSVALMEAMYAGLPVLCSNIRGNTDLIDEGKGGLLFDSTNINAAAEALKKLSYNEELKKEMSLYNQEKIKSFTVEEVKKKMIELYKNIADEA